MSNLPSYISFGVDQALALTDNYSAIAVLVDENSGKYCYPRIKSSLPDHVLIEIPSGEIHKNIETCQLVWDALTRNGFDRKALMINLGGGVIGDMGGFCAATYKRGIAFINLPTTLLSQVDASVGGKLGIDYQGLKNHIGIFQEPEHVAIDSSFLKTLPENELRSGFAEVIKHHLIRDAAGWRNLRKLSLGNQNWNELIPHSVAIKAAVVNQDPYESGIRKILNLGHTIGHALESHLLASPSPVLHGEAIAAGIICENFIATTRGMLPEEEKEDIEEYILSLYGRIHVPDRDMELIVAQAGQDKKNQGSKIQAVLLTKIGDPVWDVTITGKDIKDAIRYYQSL